MMKIQIFAVRLMPGGLFMQLKVSNGTLPV